MRTPKFKDEIKSAQLSVNRSLDWGWFNGLDVGVAYNQRDKDVSSDAFYLELTGPADPAGSPAVIPTDALRDPVTINVGGIHQQRAELGCAEHHGPVHRTLKDPWLAQTNNFQVHEKSAPVS